MNKIKECIMLLLSASTDQELQDMLNEDCWNDLARSCIQEEILNRQGKDGASNEIS